MNPAEVNQATVKAWMSWRINSRCGDKDALVAAGIPVDKFYATGRPPSSVYRFCTSCPVKVQCLLEGIVYDEMGMWGGLSEGQRKNLPLKYRMDLVEEAVRKGWFDPGRLATRDERYAYNARLILAWYRITVARLMQEQRVPPPPHIRIAPPEFDEDISEFDIFPISA